MSAPLLTIVAPEGNQAVRLARAELDRAAAELALDMMGRAFEALAMLYELMLYELRHPGEYVAQAGKLKEYVADNFRHVETALGDGLDSSTFRIAVLRVRDLFEKVDGEVAAMLPAVTMEAA